jgi:hypothetical protein
VRIKCGAEGFGCIRQWKRSMSNTYARDRVEIAGEVNSAEEYTFRLVSVKGRAVEEEP